MERKNPTFCYLHYHGIPNEFDYEGREDEEQLTREVNLVALECGYFNFLIVIETPFSEQNVKAEVSLGTP